MGRGRIEKLSARLAAASLFLGFLIGALLHGNPAASPVVAVLEPVGNLWTNALRVVVLPLALSLIVTSIAAAPRERAVGRVGIATLATFLAMLVFGAFLSIGVGTAYLAAVNPGHLTAVGSSQAPPAPPTMAAWIEGLLPKNLPEALVKGDLLPLVFFSALFAFALRQVNPERRDAVLGVLCGLRDALLVYVRWVIFLLPLGAFALAFTFSARSGAVVAGATLHFLVYLYGLLIAYIGLLYLVASLVGRLPPKRLVAATIPMQEVAIGTRSSLASLPALAESAERLDLPSHVSGFVLPLAVAVFKQNRTLTAVSRLLFVAAVFGVMLGPGQIAAFVITVLFLSFATPGIPGGGGGSTMAAYLAAGLPVEGVILFEASEPLIEFPATALNVTADLVAAILVARFTRKEVH